MSIDDHTDNILASASFQQKLKHALTALSKTSKTYVSTDDRQMLVDAIKAFMAQ